MTPKKIISAANEADIWNKVNEDFAGGVPHDYHVEIQYDNTNVELHIVSSPGGNVEGGYEYTTLKAKLPSENDFEFIIQPEDFLNRIGKFFGGQDVELGYPEFDKNVLVKTNNPERLKSFFQDEKSRRIFTDLSGYSFGIVTANEARVLELQVQRVISGNDLKHTFEAFLKALRLLNTAV